ncbi:uncharacterized protein F4812DRAFT_464199 [Daldinia caldariorum]|uniref:uncharacterized protein n=1 Tax=Daldinia caldariorum TaxID=326644 RepID=UPI002007B0C1|nr:uncharacterized protein F4812DRAFT_464199 [Daldinia caldariorum]KAI1462986.1 hypothetical protein F4812DRAFT_464199 [Daldinia caldariorum]
MDSSTKRKQPPSNGSDGRAIKKSKGGSNGRWQTPHQKAKLEAIKGRGLEVGDMGIWTTCVKGKERQALEEMMDLCEEYGEKLYGIKREDPAEGKEDEQDEDDDIESSIKKEVQEMKPASKPKGSTFEPMRMDLDCLLFIRTKPPVDPVALVKEICKDAKEITEKSQRRSRFINRFTPITLTAKATEAAVEEVAKNVLAKHFQLTGEDDEKTEAPKADAYSYAIRPSFRAHNTLKRDDVIKKVASLIAPRHKVNLSSPDKVILIDIYQTFCGMSVVDGDWDSLKRYNLHEIYLSALGPDEKKKKDTDKKGGEIAQKEVPLTEESED